LSLLEIPKKIEMKNIFLILIIQSVLNISCCHLVNNDLIQNNQKLTNSEQNLRAKRNVAFFKRNSKKIRPIIYDGYSLDLNIEIFKSIVFYYFYLFLLILLILFLIIIEKM
jgi:hypothetical protein